MPAAWVSADAAGVFYAFPMVFFKNSFDIQKICNFFTAAGSPAIFKKYFHSVGCICMSCLAGIGIFRRFSGFVTYGRTVLGRIVFRSVI